MISESPAIDTQRAATILRLKSATNAYLECLRLSLRDIAALDDGHLLNVTELALTGSHHGSPESIAQALREIHAC